MLYYLSMIIIITASESIHGIIYHLGCVPNLNIVWWLSLPTCCLLITGSPIGLGPWLLSLHCPIIPSMIGWSSMSRSAYLLSHCYGSTCRSIGCAGCPTRWKCHRRGWWWWAWVGVYWRVASAGWDWSIWIMHPCWF